MAWIPRLKVNLIVHFSEAQKLLHLGWVANGNSIQLNIMGKLFEEAQSVVKNNLETMRISNKHAKIMYKICLFVCCNNRVLSMSR